MRIFDLAHPADFDGWRMTAREALMAGRAPGDVLWRSGETAGAGDLFADAARDARAETAVKQREGAPQMRVPKAFVHLAREVVCHRHEERFALLYAALVRLQDEPQLLSKTADPLVDRLVRLAKEIRRDAHKMTAFVRFRKVGERETGDGTVREQFVSWFEPSHRIVRFKTPFFIKRFAAMDWSILTPDDCVHWDGKEATFSEGCAKPADVEDALEQAWRTYFASIFNPARLKTQAMQSEMPKKYWKNLPEASLIPDLVRSARKREAEMRDAAPTLPNPAIMKHRAIAIAPDIPSADAIESLDDLRRALGGCEHCPLHGPATQVVLGEGPSQAAMMIVGEQPGDREDLAGRPFVGPAGEVLRIVMQEAGIDDRSIFLTNAVKHFKYTPRGKRRIHQNPSAHEIDRCKWWLDKEIALVRPRVIVGLGGSALRGLTGRSLPVGRAREMTLSHGSGARIIASYHPSFILRTEASEIPRAKLLSDLIAARAMIEREDDANGQTRQLASR
ncbi:MAG: UdgX family uracil-DNA binding protein [Pseudomonadota bacterium]